MIKTRDAVWLMALAIAAGACKKGKAGGPGPAGGGRGGAPMGLPGEVVVARTGTVRDGSSPPGPIQTGQTIELPPAGGVRRRGGTALRQPRRLRHEHREARVVTHREPAAGHVPGA